MPAEDDPQLKYGNVNIAARAFVLALLELGEGKHEIEIKLFAREYVDGYKTPVIASGKFDIELSNKDKQNLAFKYAPKLPQDRWQGANKDKLLDELKIAFTKEVKKQPLIVGLYSSDWNQGVYTLTGQKYRKLAAWAIFDNADEGGQVPITTFNWVSDYVDGKWSIPRFDSHCNGCPDWEVEIQSVKAMAKAKGLKSAKLDDSNNNLEAIQGKSFETLESKTNSTNVFNLISFMVLLIGIMTLLKDKIALSNQNDTVKKVLEIIEDKHTKVVKAVFFYGIGAIFISTFYSGIFSTVIAVLVFMLGVVLNFKTIIQLVRK
jgi:hypothetical protein